MTNEREVAHDFVNKVEESIQKGFLFVTEYFDKLHAAIDQIADERASAESDSGVVSFETVLDDIASFDEAVQGSQHTSPFRNADLREEAKGKEAFFRNYWENIPDEYKTRVNSTAPNGADILNKLRDMTKGKDSF